MNERLLSALFSFRETGVCLAFSGGVDSALLLALCVKEQIPVTAVTFQTTLHPRCDLENARAITKKAGGQASGAGGGRDRRPRHHGKPA